MDMTATRIAAPSGAAARDGTAARGALLLDAVSKHFGTVRAVDDVSLALPAGSFISFLGPSGCGKTTLLRLIAGLDLPSAGRILLDGEDIAPLPTEKRDVGMVFQSLALFPHLSVGENIAYGLKLRGVARAEREQRVAKLLDMVRLPGVGARAVSQLSGGQRQRIAIARALAIDPRLFLLDEPLSALDAKLREAMQIELRQLQQDLAITTIMVTHDQREAMGMSDLIVVLNEGRVQQIGPPLEIYRRPANRFVADFIGMTNLLPVERDGPDHVRLFGARLPVAGDCPPQGALMLQIRPEVVRLRPASPPDELVGEVRLVRDLGSQVELYCDLQGTTLIVLAAPHDGHALAPGSKVAIDIPTDAVQVLPA